MVEGNSVLYYFVIYGTWAAVEAEAIYLDEPMLIKLLTGESPGV
jgi:hypothetical protein